MARLIVTAWLFVVVGVSVANASDDGMVVAPQGCNIPASNMMPIHTVLCNGDIACSQKLVNDLCVLSTIEVGK
jgi:hypothetical protein